MPKKLQTENINALIQRALAIEVEEAQDAGALGFMARAMTLASLPHSRVDGNEFERRNGAFSLSIVAPSRIGLPYGTVPRLLLSWLTTEAVRTKSRELVLGESLSGFMRQLGLVPTGGRWGSVTRLKDQTARLFASSITAVYADGQKTALLGYHVADSAILWWDAKDPTQGSLWQSTVTLTEPFFREIVERPVPVDMRALQALKRSPMALDIYCWLTYRASYLKKATEVSWAGLQGQFGADYARTGQGPRDFRRSFIRHLKAVQTVYRDAKATPTPSGLLLSPTVPHVRRIGG